MTLEELKKEIRPLDETSMEQAKELLSKYGISDWKQG